MSTHVGDSDLLTPVLSQPPLDESKHLSEYFISSSHNTYLAKGQLYGQSTAEQYKNVLDAGARCVEIDLWDGDNDEPKVTHGWTLTSNLSLRDACQAINECIHSDDFPVIISLENHASIPQQDKAVDILKESFGDKLVSTPLEGVEVPTLAQLKGKVVVKVEYYPDSLQSLQEQVEHLQIESGSDDDEETKKLRQEKEKVRPKMSSSLSALGVIAMSVKPGNREWWNARSRITEPRNAVINVGESAMSKVCNDTRALADVRHTTKTQLVRVYPHGLRIDSRNLDPLPLWRGGAQIVALNFQVFDKGLQLNKALFANRGFILKPKHVRMGETDADTRMRKLNIRVVGASDIETKGKMFFRAKLYTMEEDVRFKTNSVAAPNPRWDEDFSWTYDESDSLAILRCKITHDIPFHRDETLATWCVRATNLADGLHLVKMDDENGDESKISVLLDVSRVDA
ncbi:PLC-like phosphodiesterase [Wallemia mellicola]|nr:PLC-like phosphodiesterase [Wallemia mellicola]TIC56781.1 PLC-like phosphodiesterase [Wallemia mellicola]